MSETSLFRVEKGEKRSENKISNFCCAILKLIYNENPIVFEDIINSFITDDEYKIQISPNFIVQEALNRGKNEEKSIPDITLKQNTFNVQFEVKLYDWFKDEQLEKYIKNMSNKKDENNILFLMSANFNSDGFKEEFKNIYKSARENNIGLYKITFEYFKKVLEDKKDILSNTLKDLIDELCDLFDSAGLLENWEHRLDVVNTSKSFEDFKKGYYICPNTGGAYKHKKCKYLGAYNAKKIDALAEINAVVIVKKDSNENSVKFNMNLKINEDNIKNYKDLEKELKNSNDKLIKEAQNKVMDFGKNDEVLVFILKNIKQDVNCEKISSGGMLGSKFYVDVDNINNIKELCDIMENMKWNNKEDLENQIKNRKE